MLYSRTRATRDRWETGFLAVTCRPDCVDPVRMYGGPVNTSFSAMALDSVAQYLKESNSVLNGISRKPVFSCVYLFSFV